MQKVSFSNGASATGGGTEIQQSFQAREKAYGFGFTSRASSSFWNAVGSIAGLFVGRLAETTGTSKSKPKPLVIDNYAHGGGLEPIDFVEGYDPNTKLGLSHLRMVRVLEATGVDRALLHSLRPWANKYHARVVREYPDKFLAVCKLVQELRIPVSFVSYGRSYSSISYSSNFETLWPILLKLMDRFPDLRLVIVHGISPFRCLQEDGSVVIPESAVRLVKNFDVVMDVLPRTTQSYGPNDQVIRSFYETFGASKLAWGTEFIKKTSDTPEEYSRRRYYLQRRCPYLSSENLQQIMGGNVQRIYDLA